MRIEGSDDVDLKRWEIPGQALFGISSALAAIAILPALVGKKKRYTFTPAVEGGLAAAAPIDELPEALRCSPEAQELIVSLWTQIGAGSLSPSLYFIGREIEHTHKVHCLAQMIATPKEQLRMGFNGRFRINNIVSGIRGGVLKALSADRPANWPDLWALLPSFAKQMGKEEEQIKQLILADQYEAMVRYLFDIPV